MWPLAGSRAEGRVHERVSIDRLWSTARAAFETLDLRRLIFGAGFVIARQAATCSESMVHGDVPLGVRDSDPQDPRPRNSSLTPAFMRRLARRSSREKRPRASRACALMPRLLA